VAAVIDADRWGVWAGVECDWSGCYGHLTLRPMVEDRSTAAVVALAEEAIRQADAEGWLLRGLTYCPRHRGTWRWERLERPGTVGNGYAWALTAGEGVKGGQRPA
jgi:hypothetical protein